LSHRIVILSAGRDASLLNIRNEVLKTSGYTVVSAHSVPELMERFYLGDFDLILLCHSFSDEEQSAITAAVRGRSPSIPVLIMVAGEKPAATIAAIEASDPASLVHAVKGVVHRTAISIVKRSS
jgi:DNA-binding NtrC family response regulator